MGWSSEAVVARLVFVKGTAGGYISIQEVGGIATILLNPDSAVHVTAIPEILAGVLNAAAANERNELKLSSGTSGGRDAASYVLDAEAADASTIAVHRFFIGNTVKFAVDQYGAIIGQRVIMQPSGDPTGATDTAAVQQALNSFTEVQLSPGTYYTNAPLSVPSSVILRGSGGGLYELTGTVLKATAGFSGAAMITFPVASQGQEVRDLCLDGSAMPAGTANGIAPPSSPSHTVLSVKLENLAIQGAGIQNALGNINGGTTWRGKRIFADSTNATAFNIQNAPDSLWEDCASLGAGNHGWQPFGASNATFVACRAEFSTGNGFNLSGAWGTGNGSGGLQFIDCSTDRNMGNGVFIDATGTAPATFSGLMTRRDGNGTGDAGVHIAAGATIIPVLIDAWQCFPGVNDNGTGGLTPQFGLNVAGAVQYLGITGAYIHAATTATAGMTALNNASWRNVATRTGPTAAPAAITLVADSA